MFSFKSISSAALLAAFVVSSAIAGAQNSTLKIDTKKSSLKWFASKVTGKHDGTINLAAGSLNTDGKKVTGGGFDIDMTSITVRDIEDPSTNGKLVGHLKSPDFFSADAFKTAKFQIEKVSQKSGNDYDVSGKMTIKGITQDITFPATIITTGKSVSATGKITLDRTKWDIKYGSGKFFENIGDKAISDDFVIDFTLVAGA